MVLLASVPLSTLWGVTIGGVPPSSGGSTSTWSNGIILFYGHVPLAGPKIGGFLQM